MSAQQKQAQDEMTQRLYLAYQHILLLSKFGQESGLEGLTEDDLSLIRWAFGITKQ